MQQGREADSVHPIMKARITQSTWMQIQTAYASGIPLREIARNMQIPEGTVLARAQREGWTMQIAEAKAIVTTKTEPQSNAITVTPMQSAAISMEHRGRRHLERMAGIVEKTLPHVESMEPVLILNQIEDVDRLDRIGRRTYGLDHEGAMTVNVSIYADRPQELPSEARVIEAEEVD